MPYWGIKSKQQQQINPQQQKTADEKNTCKILQLFTVNGAEKINLRYIVNKSPLDFYNLADCYVYLCVRFIYVFKAYTPSVVAIVTN